MRWNGNLAATRAQYVYISRQKWQRTVGLSENQGANYICDLKHGESHKVMDLEGFRDNKTDDATKSQLADCCIAATSEDAACIKHNGEFPHFADSGRRYRRNQGF
jgi:hypothetical protein